MNNYWKAVPWAAVGFLVGSFAGFQWGKKAKNNIAEAVKTDYSGGVFTMQVDTVQAAKSGMADPLANLVEGLF